MAKRSPLSIALLAIVALAGNAHADECVKDSQAPAWLPCGPDRVLSETDLSTYIFKSGEISKIQLTGATSGRKYYAHYLPSGKLDFGYAGNTNIGRDWKLDGNKVCRRYYQRFYDGQFECGPFELVAGKLFMVEGSGEKNPVEGIEFQKP